MSDTNTGGPAFPVPLDAFDDREGMTLRDYFAAKAMQIMWDAYENGHSSMNNNAMPTVEIIAEDAYVMADAMLKAREYENANLANAPEKGQP
jgi:hypothetical protein